MASAEAEIRIEAAGPEDVGAIAAHFLQDLVDQALVSEARRPSLASLEALVREMVADPQRRELLRVARAVASGEVAGVLLACAITSIKLPGPALWIEELYVAPAFRQRGLGRRLVEELLHFAAERGYVGVELEAYRMNTAASILYRTLGFRRLPRERYTFDLRDREEEAG